MGVTTQGRECSESSLPADVSSPMFSPCMEEVLIEGIKHQSSVELNKKKKSIPVQMVIGFNGPEYIPVQPSIAKAIKKYKDREAKLQAKNRRKQQKQQARVEARTRSGAVYEEKKSVDMLNHPMQQFLSRDNSASKRRTKFSKKERSCGRDGNEPLAAINEYDEKGVPIPTKLSEGMQQYIEEENQEVHPEAQTVDVKHAADEEAPSKIGSYKPSGDCRGPSSKKGEVKYSDKRSAHYRNMQRHLHNESLDTICEADKYTKELTITYSAFVHSQPTEDMVGVDIEFGTALAYVREGKLPEVATGVGALADAVLCKISSGVFYNEFCAKCIRAVIYQEGIKIYYLCWGKEHHHCNETDKGSLVTRSSNVKRDYQTKQLQKDKPNFNGEIASNLLARYLGDEVQPVGRAEIISCQVRSHNGSEPKFTKHYFKRKIIDVNYFSLLAKINGREKIIFYDTGSDLTLANKSFMLKLMADGGEDIELLPNGNKTISFKVANGSQVNSSCETYLVKIAPFPDPTLKVEILVCSVEDRCCCFDDGILLGRNAMNNLMMEFRYDPQTGEPFMTMANFPHLRSPFLSASKLSQFRAQSCRIFMDDKGELQVDKVEVEEETPPEVRCFSQLYAVSAVAAWGKNSNESDVEVQFVDGKGIVWKFDDDSSGDRVYFEAMPRKGWTDQWQGSLMMQSGLLDPDNPKVRVIFNNDTNMAIAPGTILGTVSVVRKTLSYPAIIQDIFKGKKKEDDESKSRLAKLQNCFEKLRRANLDPMAFQYILGADNSIHSVQLTLENLTLGAQHYTPIMAPFTKQKKSAVDLKSVAADEKGIHVMLPFDPDKNEVENDEDLEQLFKSLPLDLTGGGPGDNSVKSRLVGVHAVRSNVSKYNLAGRWLTQCFPLKGISCEESEIDFVQFCNDDKEVLKDISKSVYDMEQQREANVSGRGVTHTIKVVPTVGDRAVRVIRAESSGKVHVEEHTGWRPIRSDGVWKNNLSPEEVNSIENVAEALPSNKLIQNVPPLEEHHIQYTTPRAYAIKEVAFEQGSVSVVKSAITNEIFLQADTIKDPQESFESLEGLTMLHPWDTDKIPATKEDLEPMVDQMLGEAEVDSEEQRNKLRQVIEPLKDIFYKSGTKLRPISHVKHRIVLTTDKPIRHPPRTMSDDQLKVAKETVQEMIELGVVRPSTSNYASSMVLVRKPDSSWRCCCDFRQLNSVTKRDMTPLPLVNDILRQISGAKWFTAVDAAKGYWQIGMHHDSIEKTAFNTPFGLFEWLAMPMGLTNSAACFQKMITEVMGPLLYECCLVYLDDIFIFSPTLEDHIKDVERVFKRLRDCGLKIRADKTTLCRRQVKCLGFILDSEGLKPLSSKIDAIKNVKVEKTRRGVMSFLGLTRYYARFVPKLAELALPLTSMLKKDKKVERDWGEEQDEAVRKIKHAFSKPGLVLTRFDPQRPVLLQTDASGFALGAVISHYQVDENGKRTVEEPICFASRTMNPHQRNYSVSEQEGLAVVWACDLFRSMLLHRRFILETDHSALKQLLTTRDPGGRLCRWFLKLQEFDIDITYRRGCLNTNADFLSRSSQIMPEPQTLSLISLQGKNKSHAAKIQKAYEEAQGEDLDTQFNIKSWKDRKRPSGHSAAVVVRADFEGPKPNDGIAMGDYDSLSQVRIIQPTDPAGQIGRRIRSEEFALQSQTDPALLLLEHYKITGEFGNQVPNNHPKINIIRQWVKKVAPFANKREDGSWEMEVTRERANNIYEKAKIRLVPAALTNRVMAKTHNDGMAGHQSSRRTLEMVREGHSWPGMASQVEQFVQSCPTCQAYDIPHPPKEVGEYPNPGAPFRVVAFDFLGPLGNKKGAGGYKYCLVLVDMMSRFVFLVPCKSTKSGEIIKAFRDKVIPFCGCPAICFCDNERSFQSKKSRVFFDEIGCVLHPVPAGASRSNGLVERTIKSVHALLKKMVGEKDWSKWPSYLGLCEYTLRNSRRDDINLSPFEILFGFRPRGPHSNDLEEPIQDHTPLQMWTMARREYRRIRAETDEKQRQQRRINTASKTHPGPKFRVGDLIRRRIKHSRNKDGLPKKWWPQFREVYRILENPSWGRYVCLRSDPAPIRLALLDERNMKRAYPVEAEEN